MNAFWDLLGDPHTDRAVLRVYRWLLQWPESMAHQTTLSVGEMSRGTGLAEDDIELAIRDLVERGFLTIHETRPDGVKVFTLSLNGPQASQNTYISRPRKVRRKEGRIVSLRLRWRVLERDGFTCRACGATVEDGAKLVMDHVKPYSKGGRTTEANLQTLCEDCNAGKFDRWIEIA